MLFAATSVFLIIQGNLLEVKRFEVNVLNTKHFIRAREALRQCLPDQLRDNTFAACLKDDKSTKQWMAQLLKNIETASNIGVDPRLANLPQMPQP